jgi:transcriptional regulator with XRE-family HTH domain
MKSVEFGSYIKSIRESKNIPQRIVAHALDVDTSTLSKMELGERQVLIAMIPKLAKVLGVDFKELQIKYIVEKNLFEFEGQPYLKEALTEILKKLK